jgi:hypothetical protein
MSTDAWIEEHWIGEAVLPRPRRAPKLPALSVPHAPTCSRGNAALAAHAQSRDSARHPGDGLSARQDGRNVVDQQARKLTQPPDLRTEISNCDKGPPYSVAAYVDEDVHDRQSMRRALNVVSGRSSNRRASSTHRRCSRAHAIGRHLIETTARPLAPHPRHRTRP